MRRKRSGRVGVGSTVAERDTTKFHRWLTLLPSSLACASSPIERWPPFPFAVSALFSVKLQPTAFDSSTDSQLEIIDETDSDDPLVLARRIETCHKTEGIDFLTRLDHGAVALSDTVLLRASAANLEIRFMQMTFLLRRA
ncbi:transporter [Pseudozyma hubeiensis SY62]|uniref:Transporter n=1 Tax=Pseudozyma hubeiensis (strain SY62) TaxID=1305764 RepID=R9P206_PSEHS|nr:transporter [Pseudozyma hubeiensis SY62]GAC95353.1 transporter [Pseudozyma hubeiensis SY62]